MTPKIQSAITALVQALREESHEEVVSLTLFVNCEEYTTRTAARTAEDLKSAGISMRNLRGEFIK